jgi:hypothetical protein
LSASGVCGVGGELAVDRVAHVTFERPQGFFLGPARGQASIEVHAAIGAWVAQLADDGHVECVVEAAVSPLGQPVDGAAAG